MRRHLLTAVGAVLAACMSIPEPPATMERVDSAPEAAPAGKSLVVFHRPSRYGGEWVVRLFDGTRGVGEIMGAQSTYWVCEPGRHHFIARLGEHDFRTKLTVVEAELAPDQVYDMVCDIGAGLGYASVRLFPLVRGDARRSKVASWLESASWYRLVPGKADSLDSAHREENAQAISDFTAGEKRDRLLRMAAVDHR